MPLQYLAIGFDEIQRRIVHLDHGEMTEHGMWRQAQNFGQECGRFYLVTGGDDRDKVKTRSEEHTSELQSLMRISYAVFCLKKKKTTPTRNTTHTTYIEQKPHTLAHNTRSTNH